MCEICATSPLERHALGPVTRRAALAGVLAAPLAALAACATNPVTGRSQLILIDDGQLQRMALDAWAQERARNPVWNNPGANARLQRVGARIARVVNLPNAQWEFVLFDRPARNAYVLPGGKVGFFRGLMEICERDDHIATVIGHEVGHVVGRHAAERVSRSLAQQGLVGLAGNATDSALLRQAIGIGAQVGFELPFSREQESEADRVGLDIMHAAGYDVRQAIPFWERMSAAGGSRPPELLSTHPAPSTRIADIRNHINQRGWGPA